MGFVFGFKTYFYSIITILKSFKLIRYSLLPILINVTIFCLVVYFGFAYYGKLIDLILPARELWWQILIYWLSWLIAPLIFVTVLFYIFGLVAFTIAAPFLSILSYKYLKILDPSVSYKIPMGFARSMLEEIKKVTFIMFIALFSFLLNFIPVVGQVLYFMISSILFSFEFLDYPMEHAEYIFRKRLSFVFRNFGTSFGFGIAITLSFMIPIIGFFMLPVSTVAATKIFIEGVNKSK